MVCLVRSRLHHFTKCHSCVGRLFQRESKNKSFVFATFNRRHLCRTTLSAVSQGKGDSTHLQTVNVCMNQRHTMIVVSLNRPAWSLSPQTMSAASTIEHLQGELQCVDMHQRGAGLFALGQFNGGITMYKLFCLVCKINSFVLDHLLVDTTHFKIRLIISQSVSLTIIGWIHY